MDDETKIMDDETRADLLDQVEQSRFIDEMVKTTGWSKIVIPRFEQMKENAMLNLLNASKLEDIYRAQETVKAIDSIITTLMIKVKDGDEAKEVLAKEKE